jgi:hypothetical protein
MGDFGDEYVWHVEGGSWNNLIENSFDSAFRLGATQQPDFEKDISEANTA